ncbi:PhnO protein [Luteimonas cucumeris]|uniref:PhnO protein n=1 Tax=Luteimonas cucumeris TaxID=985012 RepID=A0A562L5X2_9GAMM|nr:GNAT family N-acetyltransferase [Luteimonas cucumeris]TWI03005.1 PhnO protein [Luteimonas cucumeris]
MARAAGHAIPQHLRPATPDDAADVARLLGELGYPCDRDEAAARIVTILSDKAQTLLLADAHGETCGLVALHSLYAVTHGAGISRITALVVAESHRGRGIGRLLLRGAEINARLAGAARIEVTSSAQRSQAHDFYRQCGYANGSLRFVKPLGAA